MTAQPTPQARYGRRRSNEGSDIGELPPQTERGRELWERCRKDLVTWHRVVFPGSTGLRPFGQVHLDSIAHSQETILRGGRIVKAEPRGFGKTTRTVNEALWALLYGYRRFVVVFGSSLTKASAIADGIKMELQENDLLAEMFPGVIHAIRSLEGKAQRARFQTYAGESTHIGWSADMAALPIVPGPGSDGAGAVVMARPVHNARGIQHRHPDGTVLRPDFVFLDDPQTDADARSMTSVEKICGTISKSVLRLGSHATTLSAICTCTVIEEDDVAERLLRDSSWRRVRYKMLAERAKEEGLWLNEYARIRADYAPEDPEGQRRAHKEALAYYAANRDKMDEGAIATWEWAYAWGDEDPLEISAVQHAYNILIDDGEQVFATECQNEPLRIESSEFRTLTAREIANKKHNTARDVVPIGCNHLVAYSDVQQDLLYWVVMAFGEDFTGTVVSYGAWPEQSAEYYTLSTARNKLSKRYGGDIDANIYQGIQDLAKHLTEREWVHEDGSTAKLERGLFDSGFKTELVNQAVRQLPYGSVWMPAMGVGIGAKGQPLNTGKRREGERRGLHWAIRPTASGGKMRYVLIDTNFWKTFLHERLLTARGSAGCLTLYQPPQARSHKMLAGQLISEKPHRVEANGRTVIEWGNPQPGRENHLLDCCVGCCVAASMGGVTLPELRTVQSRAKKRKKVTYL